MGRTESIETYYDAAAVAGNDVAAAVVAVAGRGGLDAEEFEVVGTVGRNVLSAYGSFVVVVAAAVVVAVVAAAAAAAVVVVVVAADADVGSDAAGADVVAVAAA